MKKTFIAIASGIAAVGIALAPTASADVQSYMQALANGGFGGYSASEALAVGQIACQTPGTANDKATAVYNNTVADIDWAEAQYIAAAALIHLC